MRVGLLERKGINREHLSTIRIPLLSLGMRISAFIEKRKNIRFCPNKNRNHEGPTKRKTGSSWFFFGGRRKGVIMKKNNRSGFVSLEVSEVNV